MPFLCFFCCLFALLFFKRASTSCSKKQQQRIRSGSDRVRAKIAHQLDVPARRLSGWRLSFLPLSHTHTHILQQLLSPGAQGARQKQRTRWFPSLGMDVARTVRASLLFCPASKMKMDTAARCSAASFPLPFTHVHTSTHPHHTSTHACLRALDSRRLQGGQGVGLPNP